MTEFVRDLLAAAADGMSVHELRAAIDARPEFSGRLEQRPTTLSELIRRLETSGEIETDGDRLRKTRLLYR